MRWVLVVVGLVTVAGVSLATLVPAHAATVGPANGGFEDAAGWAPADGGTLTIDASQPVNGGSAAGHVVSSAAAPVTIRTQYWLTPAAPTNHYTLTLAVRIPAATMTSVTARIDLVSDLGAVLVSNSRAQAGPTAGYVTISTTPVTAPPGTAYALVVITGTPTTAGARFSVDDLVIDEVVPPPPPPSPPEPIVVDVAPSEAEPVVPTATPIPRGAAGPFPSATATPAPRGTALLNGSFDTGLAGWSVVQGRAWTDTWIPGEGHSLVLHTDSASVVWAEQPVNGIEPGAWYSASALLSTTGEVDVGWLRVAWYDSPDGGGRALGNDDSLAVGTVEGRELAAAPRYQVVGTRAIQAPLLAKSATVRFILRSSAAASLIIDNVTFGATADPEAATQPAEPRPVTPPLAAAIESPVVLAGAFPRAARSDAEAPAAARVAAPRAAPAPRPPSAAQATAAPTARAAAPPATSSSGLRTEDVVAPGVSDAQRGFRMTQVLPDPANPGRDTDYEWVELTNLGASAASVEGMTLRDNSGSVVLPALVIPAGGSLVVTARLAEVAGATAFRLPQGIGNGLGNTGDRLVLTSADGRQVDAFSYGDDDTFLAGARIPVPGAGRAIAREFAPDGTFRAARVVDRPVAGVAPPPAAREAARASAATGAIGTWVVLLSLGAGLLGGAAAQRLSAVARGGRR